jgi:hypothetical protein
MAISALVDLEPISLSWLNEKLKLTDAEISAHSPLRHINHGAPMTIAVGTSELPELQRHSAEYAQAAVESGEPARYMTLEARNHFTILEELADPEGALCLALAGAVAARN